MSPPLRLCLVGAGVAGSPSAAMHAAALRARGLRGSYVNRELALSQVPEFIAELRSGTYRGCNVTIPFKAVLSAACDTLSGDAQQLRVVNTISLESGRIVGDNTDARGFELALRAQGLWPAAGVRALVLGAGGAAAAVVLALTRAGARHITVAARRVGAAAEIAGRLSLLSQIEVSAWGGEQLSGEVQRAGLLVNATAVGLAQLPVDVRELISSCTVADVRYRPRPVDLVEAALAAGLRACDGLEMLVQQAALSFEAWTGAEAPLSVMRHAASAAVHA